MMKEIETRQFDTFGVESKLEMLLALRLHTHMEEKGLKSVKSIPSAVLK